MPSKSEKKAKSRHTSGQKEYSKDQKHGEALSSSYRVSSEEGLASSLSISRAAATDVNGFGSTAGTTAIPKTDAVNLTEEDEDIVSMAMNFLYDTLYPSSLPGSDAECACAAVQPTVPAPAATLDSGRREKLDAYFGTCFFGLTEGEQRLVLYRYLNSESFDITKAVRNFVSTVEFRKRQKLSRMALFPSLIPTRGYNERQICRDLGLPFLEDWQLASAGVTTGPASPRSDRRLIDESGRIVLHHTMDLDCYYQTSYSTYLDDSAVTPGSPLSHIHATVGSASLSASNRTSAVSASGAFHVLVPQGGSDDSPALEVGSGAEVNTGCLNTPRSCISAHDQGGSSHSTSERSASVGPRRQNHGSPADRDSATVLEKGRRSPCGGQCQHCHSSPVSGPDPLSRETDAAPQQHQQLPNGGFLERMVNRFNPFGGRGAASAVAAGEHLGDAARRCSHFLTSNHGLHVDPCDGDGGGALVTQHASEDGPLTCASTHSNATDDSARLVDQEAAEFINADGLSRPVAPGPRSTFHDALDFHALLQPIIRTITRYLPTSFHYWDKEGRPVLYIKLGPMRSRKLMKDLFQLTPVSTEPKALALLFHVYTLELMTQLIRVSNRKNQRDNAIRDALLSGQPSFDLPANSGKHMPSKSILPEKEPTRSCVVIINCAHVRLKKLLYKPLMQVVKPIISLDQKHYPDLLHHLYIVNCNTAMNLTYLMMRGVLHEDTRRKISFCTRGSTAKTLRSVIDGDLLPVELGGRCECPGGCGPEFKLSTDAGSCDSGRTGSESGTVEHDILSESFAFSETLVSGGTGTRKRLNCTVERLSVKPRKKVTLSIAVAAHEEIFWEFRCRNDRSVSFSITYFPMTAGGGMYSLSDPARVKDGASHYVCPSPGTVILEWHNKYSHLHRIHIHAKIFQESTGDVGVTSTYV